MQNIDSTLQHLQDLESRGNLKQAIAYGQTLIQNHSIEDDGAYYGTLSCMLASLIGRAESAQKEREILISAEERMRNTFALKNSETLMAIQWHLAFHFFHMLQYNDALHWINRAIELAGRLVDMDWLLKSSQLKSYIFQEIGIQSEVMRHNALAGTLGDIYNDTTLKERLIGDPTWSYVGSGITLPEGDLYLRELRDELCGHRETTREQIATVRQKIVSVWNREDVITLSECWFYFLKAAGGNRTLGDNDDGRRTSDLLQRLTPLRARRIMLKLTDEALRKKITSYEFQDTLRKFHLKLREECIVNLDKSLYRRHFIQRYARSLSYATERDGVLTPEEFLRAVHYTKPLDLRENTNSHKDRKKTKLLRHDQDYIIQSEFIPEEELVHPTDQIPLKIDQLYHVLNQENAALFEYFISNTTGHSHLLVSYQNNTSIFPLSINQNQLDKYFDNLRSIVTASADKTDIQSNESIAGSLSNLSAKSAATSTVFNILRSLGKTLFPREALELVSHASTLYLAPHYRLYAIPLHALPIGTDNPLISYHPVCYIPKGSYLLHTSSLEAKNEEPYLCINAEDREIRGDTFLTLFENSQARNHWSDMLTISNRLETMANHKSVWLFLHGSLAAKKWQSRLALPAGQRLTTNDIEQVRKYFNGTEIYLFVCHSHQVTIRQGYEYLGFTSAFLHKGADSVLASLWANRADAAIEFARPFIQARIDGKKRSDAFLCAAQTVLDTLKSNDPRWFDYAGFVLYGGDGVP